MESQSFYVPVFPSNAAENAPYQPPEFWPLVNVLRGIMYQLKSREPENCDLPKVGEDKDLDKRVRLYIERKWGNKNNTTKAQQIARLSRRCFEQVKKIAEDPRKFVKSERITSYSFLFLKHTYKEEQVYQMLTSVVNGEKVIADLNKEYKSSGLGKRKRREDHEAPDSQGVEEDDEERRDDVSQLSAEKESSQETQEVEMLHAEIEELTTDIRDEKKTVLELRRTLRSALEENKQLREKISELVNEKDEMRDWYEKKIHDLQCEMASSRRPFPTGSLDETDTEEATKENKSAHLKARNVKAAKPSQLLKNKGTENKGNFEVEVKEKKIKLVLEDVQALSAGDGKNQVIKSVKHEQVQRMEDEVSLNERVEADERISDVDVIMAERGKTNELNQTLKAESSKNQVVKSEPKGDKVQKVVNEAENNKKVEKENIADVDCIIAEETPKTPKTPTKNGNEETADAESSKASDVEAKEWVWVAAFYPHIYYVGRVAKLLPDGQVTIKFLERRPGGVFQYRRDLETIEKKWVFIRGLKVEMSGKKEFIIHDTKAIEKKYEEFKKNFLLKQKVDAAWNLDKYQDLGATLVHAGGIDISIADFKSIQMDMPTDDKLRLDELQKSKGKNGFEVGWLNDQVMNACFQIQEIEGKKEGKSVTFANTFLYNKIESLGESQSNAESMKRWILKGKMSQSEIVMLPINKNGIHWVLGVIKKKEKTISYYDSENKDPMPSFFKHIRNFLSLQGIDLSGWRDVCQKSPQQTDCASCGVFVIENAKRLLNEKALDFSQKDVEELRYQIAISLLSNKK